MLIDSHCHLDMLDAGALPAILDRARAAGVGEVVSIGTRLAQSAGLRDLVAGLSDVWCTVGIHPHNAGEQPTPDVATLVALTDHPRVIGIGESGLDYHYDLAPREAQQASFRAHIRAARVARMPIAIHARNADDDIAAILREEHAAGAFDLLLHCFSSGRALAETAIALGGYVSFSGILTFPKSHELRAVAADLPAERLLVETDAPYLAPVPHRGKTNEPAWVAQTAGVLAQVRSLTPEALADLTTTNFKRLFRRAA